MSSAAAERSDFDSYAAFHRYAYAGSIADSRDALGANLLISSQPAGSWSNAATPDLVIGRCVGGQGLGVADIGAGRFRTTGRRGESMVLPPGVGTRFDIRAAHTVLILGVPYARLSALDAELRLPPDGDFGALHRGSFEDPLMAGIVDRIWDESAEASAVGRLFLEGALLALVALVLRRADSAAEAPRGGGLAPWQVRRSIDRLAAAIQAEVSLRDLAADVGLSPFHFARAFRRSTGLPPHRYHVRLRMERAQTLLETTELGVTAVALAVGYSTGQAFARAFLRETGTTPSAWRATRRSAEDRRRP
jgi:AraC family transcriptional regulator